MDEKTYKPQYNFELMLFNGFGNTSMYWIETDIDLLDAYKTYLLQGKGYLIWEKGVIDCSKVFGLMKK